MSRRDLREPEGETPSGHPTEPPVIELANIRFLAGYRRRHLIDDALVRQVRAAGIEGAILAEAMKQIRGPAPTVRATILHLIWTQELIIDMTQPLTARTLLRRRTA